MQVADRFNPFIGIFDFSDHTELVQLIEALGGLALGQILTSADTDIITLSIGFYVFRAGKLAYAQTPQTEFERIQ